MNIKTKVRSDHLNHVWPGNGSDLFLPPRGPFWQELQFSCFKMQKQMVLESNQIVQTTKNAEKKLLQLEAN